MTKLAAFYAKAKKTVVAVAAGAIGWGTAVVASPSGPITSTEWIMLATVLASALGVYAATNTST